MPGSVPIKTAHAAVVPVNAPPHIRKGHTCSAASGQLAIRWDQQPLGLVSDSELARQLGVSSAAVYKARTKRKLPPYRETLAERWVDHGLGVVPDLVLAEKVGKSRRTVSRVRGGLGLHGPSTVEWDREPLGEVPDVILARMHNVDPSVVGIARRRRGIPRGDLEWTTTEGEPATYPEACIDLWFHERGIPHTFQVRVGPFIADWQIGNMVVEYAGFGGHHWFEAEYQERLNRKKLFYERLGLEVRIIRSAEVKQFQPEGFPIFRPKNRTCVGCGARFDGQQRHKARGMCQCCYRKAT